MPENFFKAESKLGRDAMKKRIAELGRTLVANRDPRKMVKKHPLASVAAVAAAGLVLGFMMARSRCRNAPTHAPKDEPQHDGKRDGNGTGRHQHAAAFLSHLESELLRIIRPILQTVVTTTTATLLSRPGRDAVHSGKGPESPPKPFP